MKEFLLQLFTWWNGATMGLRFFTWRHGEFVGQDKSGNRYYRAPSAVPRSIQEHRWVIYNGYADASKIPPGWHGWMHFRDALPPTSVDYQPREWQLPHQPDLTGTSEAYRPSGSLRNPRPEAQGEPAYYPWRPEVMKQNLMETAVGALVIAIALGFFIFMYTTTGVGKGQGGYHLTAKFKNVEGINIGSDIRMSGIKVGSVTGQVLDPQSYDAVLTFSVDPTVKLPDNSTAKITSEGLLGGKFIALEPGGSEAMLADGGTITYTQGALDLWALVSDYMFSGKGKTSDGGGGGSGGSSGSGATTGGGAGGSSGQDSATPAPAPSSAKQDGSGSYPTPAIEPYPAPENQPAQGGGGQSAPQTPAMGETPSGQ